MYINFDLKENKYKNIILNAKKFSNFRQRCKEFLKNNGINHNKFTVVSVCITFLIRCCFNYLLQR